MMFQMLSMTALLSVFLSIIIPVSSLVLYEQNPDRQLSLSSRRRVYNPNITSPTATTVWKVGDQVDVTWDLRDIPQESWMQRSQIVLGWLEPGSSDEHLDLDHPLAKDFTIGDRHATFTVPDVEPRSNYIVVVFGDSGNHSPTFSITS